MSLYSSTYLALFQIQFIIVLRSRSFKLLDFQGLCLCGLSGFCAIIKAFLLFEYCRFGIAFKTEVLSVKVNLTAAFLPHVLSQSKYLYHLLESLLVLSCYRYLYFSSLLIIITVIFVVGFL